MELIASTMLGNVFSTVLAIYAFEDPLDVEEAVRIWIFKIGALFVVDWTKMIYKFIFNHNAAGVIDEDAIHAEDEAMKKPSEEDEPVVEFAKSIAKQRESVRLLADQVSARQRKSAKSFKFLAEGKTRPSRTTFHTVQQSKSVRMTGSKSVRFDGRLQKMTPGTLARQSSGVMS